MEASSPSSTARDATLQIPPLETSGRVARVRDDSTGEALLVTDLTNIRWLTVSPFSNGWALITDDEVILLTDGRYGDQATAELAQAGVAGRVVVSLSEPPCSTRSRQSLASVPSVGFERRMELRTVSNGSKERQDIARAVAGVVEPRGGAGSTARSPVWRRRARSLMPPFRSRRQHGRSHRGRSAQCVGDPHARLVQTAELRNDCRHRAGQCGAANHRPTTR